LSEFRLISSHQSWPINKNLQEEWQKNIKCGTFKLPLHATTSLFQSTNSFPAVNGKKAFQKYFQNSSDSATKNEGTVYACDEFAPTVDWYFNPVKSN
jgi:hypothetical protein